MENNTQIISAQIISSDAEFIEKNQRRLYLTEKKIINNTLHESEVNELKALQLSCFNYLELKHQKKNFIMPERRQKIHEVMNEARVALYGCREVLSSAANIQHAINLLTTEIDILEYSLIPPSTQSTGVSSGN